MTETDSQRLFSPERNFGAGGDFRQIVDLSGWSDQQSLSSFLLSHAEVAKLAEKVAAAERSNRVVAFAISDADRLLPAGNLSFDTIAIDCQKVPAGSKKMAEQRRRLYGDLSDPADLEKIKAAIGDDSSPTVFIVYGVLERLQDVRPLLRCLRSLLRLNSGSQLLIVTPDRENAVKSKSWSKTGRSFFRLWSLSELREALALAGFEVADVVATAPSANKSAKTTLLATVRCGRKFYKNFLRGMGLPPSADHLVLTSEHAQAESTGGIGTYHQMVEHVTGVPRIILFSGMHGLPTDWQEYTEKKGWIHVARMVVDNSPIIADPWRHNYELILSAVLQTVFLYDEIKLIEFQDYMGIGMRVAQAKRARLIPPSITVLTYAHGTQFYLDHAAGTVSTSRDIRLDAHERLALELSDVVAFPSTFLRNLYVETQGLSLRSVEMQAYPIEVPVSGLPSIKPAKTTTLVFYGKQTPQKGYPDFCDAVLEIFSDPKYSEAARSIKRIALMGVTEPDVRLQALKGVEIIHGYWTRQRAVEMLHQFGEGSIVVLPYRGDNHPLSIFEVVEADCQLLAYRTGGLPEILPESLHDHLLCDPEARHLAAALAREITQDPAERAVLITKTRKLLAEKYALIATNYAKFVGRLKTPTARETSSTGDVSVIVPNYNGPAEYLKDVAFGLVNSIRKPAEIIIVDDGSSDENYKALMGTVKSFAPLDIRVERNAANVGLAQTRNNGLGFVQTAYVCAHDNDNVVLNDFLEKACRILDENPDVAAVTCWLTGFKDGDSWHSYNPNDYRYRPLGPDLGLGYQGNEFGDALAVYRVSALKRVGGWDGSTKALWEDWQLFLRMTALGENILVIPKEMFLYRIRPDSMARTYNQFHGYQRLAKVLPGLRKSQSYSLLRAIISPTGDVQRELEHLRWERDYLKTELAKKQLEVASQAKRNISIVTASRTERQLLRKRFEAEIEQLRSGFKPEGKPVAQEKGPITIEDRVVGEKRSAAEGLVLRVLSAFRSANTHERLLRGSAFFDAKWYAEQYGALFKPGRNAYRDYLEGGANEGRDPGPFFNTRQYLLDNPDVALAGMNPLVHYISYGMNENRTVKNSLLVNRDAPKAQRTRK